MLSYRKKIKNRVNKTIKRCLTLTAAGVILMTAVFSYLPVSVHAGEINTASPTGAALPETKKDVWPEAPEISAEAAILFEVSTGTTVYSKNATEKYYPASTTKLMTALLAVERCPLSDVVTMSYEAISSVGWDSSRIGVISGEKLTMEQCLYSILLASANEVTYAVAEHIGSTSENFVKMMNQRAAELGLINTNFTNPHGLHDEFHYTCAYDLALIMKKCIEYTTFCRISNNHYYEIPPTNLCEESRVIAQTHQILRKKIKYDGVFAGKTGHTDEAGNCLVTACERDGLQFICVVLKEPTSESCYTDTIALFDYGYQNFSKVSMSASDNGTKSNAFPVLFSDEDAFVYEVSSALSVSEATVLLPVGASFEDVKNECTLTPLLKTEKGENVIGTAYFYYAGVRVGNTEIIYTADKEEVLDEAAYYMAQYGNTPEFDQAEYDRIRGILPEPEPEPEKDLRPMIIGFLTGGVVLILGIVVVLMNNRKQG